jgi:hypothetical protein
MLDALLAAAAKKWFLCLFSGNKFENNFFVFNFFNLKFFVLEYKHRRVGKKLILN